MWKWFTSVDVDGNGRITAVELQQALKNGNHTSFDISTIEMLIRLFVCVNCFQYLWKSFLKPFGT